MAATQRAYSAEPRQMPREYGKPEYVTKKKTKSLNPERKKSMLLMLLIIGMISIAIIISNAYVASLAYSNNKIVKENNAIVSEIESLTIELQSSRNISNIEKSAVNKIGMVAPEGGSYVDIAARNNNVKNMASAMKKEAFN